MQEQPLESTATRHEGRHSHRASLDDGLDFVNTLDRDGPRTVDRLADLAVALDWLRARGLLHAGTVEEQLADYAADADGEQRALRRIRRLRGALRELLDATVERRPADQSALREVNRSLRAQYVYELVPAPDGISIDHRHHGDPIAGALAPLAEAIARHLTASNAERLRICANDACGWFFYDASPAGRRKWCDMAVCGNRAKVARHRARQRGVESLAGEP